MTTEKAEAFEYKHLECPQSWVDAILREYSSFYWDLVATQTVVSKESHLERGKYDSDTIYSVTTTERFSTIDLKRKRSIPNIERIKEAERKYFQLCGSLIGLGCSPVDNYTTPPLEKSIGCGIVLLYIFGIFPGILASQKIKADNERNLLEYQRLKTELDGLMTTNKQLLNI